MSLQELRFIESQAIQRNINMKYIYRKSSIYLKMAENILSKITSKYIYRIDVGYNIKKKNINSFIGREAHLQFLENEVLFKMISYCYADFFQ